MNNKIQWALGAGAGVVMVSAMTTSLNLAQAADTAAFEPSIDQKITTRQVAGLLEREHYLDMPLDAAMGQKILSNYLDTLDPNRTLFLQSDVDEFNQKYAKDYAQRLKHGDLSAGIAIFERYRSRSNEYYAYAKKLLNQKTPNLNTQKTIVLDREKLPRFKTKAEQESYWHSQTLYALIGLTLSQEDDKQKDKAFLDNPDLLRGQDLVKSETRSPSEVLLARLERQKKQLARLKNDEIMEQILNSAMLAYDPHSNYFAPVQADEMKIHTNLQLEGIGVSIRPDRKNPDYTRIVTLVDGGPAAKTGQVRPNDLILGVAQEGQPMVDVVGFSTREIVALIRGKKGTDVTIKVKQPNSPDSSARNVLITRDVIKQDEVGVQHRVVTMDHQGQKKRVGVLEIPSFYINFDALRSGQTNYRSVSADTKAALQALNEQNIDGLVVDLRGNPGGSLDEVVKMLGFFIQSGPAVQIRDNQGHVLVYRTGDKDPIYAGDMVVVVNLASASASEIFAAAIQDYGRGLVVGSTTTGKGSAQSQRDALALGSANITQRKFYRITGGSTQNKGVVPDVSLVNVYENAEFGERSYKNPLAWDTIKTAPYRPYGKYAKPLIQMLNAKSQARQSQDPDFVYLKSLNAIAKANSDKKPVLVSLQARRQKDRETEQKTLLAENTRRQAKGEVPYTSWATYQATLDAQFEEWGRLKENERPKLPESEAYVLEAARILFDAKTSRP